MLDVEVLYFCETEDKPFVESLISRLKKIQCSSGVRFMKVDDTITDWKQLLLMSLCHHNIIANSSFSWWAAYFNNNIHKIITYPSEWFGPDFHYKNVLDMFPSTWNKIESKEIVEV